MKEISINCPNGVEQLSKELRTKLTNPVFLCIGTDKVFSDSLGPKVGTLLNGAMDRPLFVYGMHTQNITAENLAYAHEFVKRLHPNNQIVVVDAAVGDGWQLGHVQISDGGIFPGAATNKNLPRVGDISIIGIVAEKGMADFYTTSQEKNQLVTQVAQFICGAILQAMEN